MPNKLTDVLIDLGSDPENIEALKRDPDDYLKRYDLTDDEKEGVKEALRTHDADPILKRIPPDELAKHRHHHVVNIQVNIL